MRYEVQKESPRTVDGDTCGNSILTSFIARIRMGYGAVVTHSVAVVYGTVMQVGTSVVPVGWQSGPPGHTSSEGNEVENLGP